MKVLVRANDESKPFSKENSYFNIVLENNVISTGTCHFETLWDSRFLKSTRTINNADHSRTFSVIDIPDTPITFEELLDQYPELLL